MAEALLFRPRAELFGCRRSCAVKASNFNKAQQLSMTGPQQVQYQSVANSNFQQLSISNRNRIWFGTRGLTTKKFFRFNIENCKDIERC
jgi:hypothetical protein